MSKYVTLSMRRRARDVRHVNPTPLSPAQIWALACAATRELIWGMPAVAKEIDIWRVRAEGIPDPSIRADALAALDLKRTHLDGAALLWILPRRRHLVLLHLLVTYELILEFLDNMNERAARAGTVNGRHLHRALIDAVDPAAPISDYYQHHPWKDDGGYLQALVEACRERCGSLASYPLVRQIVIGEATRAQVLALNHEPNPRDRDRALRGWAEQQFPGERQASWFELAGASTAPLTIHLLFALAAEATCDETAVRDTCAVYFPRLCVIATMLDSYVDQAHDSISGNHSYICHYPSSDVATQRIAELIHGVSRDVRDLPDGHRHVVIVACMIAMYLSHDAAQIPEQRRTQREWIRASGSVARVMLPISRLWRVAHGLGAA